MINCNAVFLLRTRYQPTVILCASVMISVSLNRSFESGCPETYSRTTSESADEIDCLLCDQTLPYAVQVLQSYANPSDCLNPNKIDRHPVSVARYAPFKHALKVSDGT